MMYCRTGHDGGKKKFQQGLSGSAHILMLGTLMVTFVIGGGYLYSVNQSAGQGYHMRTLEKEIDILKQDNANLKVTEADLRSLYRIETAEEDLHMEKVENAIYLEERGPVALK
jgi:hypothetical protein